MSVAAEGARAGDPGGLDPDLAASLGRDLCAAAAELYRRGWCLGTGGNFSAVLGRDPLRLLVTRSGRPKGALTPGDLVVIDGDARPVADPAGRPSAEARLHAAIARGLGAGAGAILHTHSIPGTLLSERFVADGGFLMGGYEMLKGLGCVSTHEARVRVAVLPNSQDMAPLERAIAALVEDAKATAPAGSAADPPARPPGFLIAGHGLYAWGPTLAEAQARVEVFEFLFELLARRMAFAPFDGR